MAAIDRPDEAYHSPEESLPGAFPDHEAVLSSQQSLNQAVYARRHEYTEPKRIRIKIGTWNVGNFDCERDIGAWFAEGRGADLAFSSLSLSAAEAEKQRKEVSQKAKEAIDAQEKRQSSIPKHESTLPTGDEEHLPAGTDIDLYVLGLQEIVDVTSPTEALRPYTDPAPAARYKDAMEGVLPSGFTLVAEQQLIGLLLLIYASPNIAEDVRSVSTSSVGTGLMGYMGNKGAVAAHIILGEATRILFVNCHLAAGSDKTSLDRRNWDYGQISSRMRFDRVEDPSGVPISGGESIGDEDFAFWFGDLNYRLEGIPGDDVRRLLSRHAAQGEFTDITSELGTDKDAETKSNKEQDEDEVPENMDPASLQTTISSLWSHDELTQQIHLHKSFHTGWHEGPIRFLPTYKYDVGRVSVFDSSEKRRGPSWCDRILYRTRKDFLQYRKRLDEEEVARKRDEEMKARGLDGPDNEDLIFQYNPEEDGHQESEEDLFADPETQVVETRDGHKSEILQEYYTSHQRVLSSDHKPLDSIFSLTYQAVVADKKSKVHAEVARELDRAENEGRPTITLVIEKSHGGEKHYDDHDDDNLSHSSSGTSNYVTDGVLYFGNIKLNKPKHASITIANTGAVSATFGLVDRPVAGLGEEGPIPPWLSAQFSIAHDKPSKKDSKDEDDHNTIKGPSYTLEPGETCNIAFTALVSSHEMARNLNDRVTALDEILILRVKGGRDHFIPVQGRWIRSSITSHIESAGHTLKSVSSSILEGRKSDDSGERGRGSGSPIDKLRGVAEDGFRRLQQQKPSGNPKSLFGFGKGSES